MFIEHIIQEAQDYAGMFNDILKLNDPRLRHEITQDIDWARKTLRKNDRIVWFLRWVKVWLISTATGSSVAAPAFPGALQRQNRRSGTTYGAGDVMSAPVLKQQLGHFLSLPIPEIQSHVFQAESPRQLFEMFAKYEAAWRQRVEEEKSLITPEPDDEMLIAFPDGFAWWLLPRGGCPAEAQAMGHCGNVPSERPGDRILSLRRKVRRGDVERWYPVATFILDRDGQLGEMKGRGNDKPAAKYHPYIVELLRHHIISGIKGGGYMPENNFAMSDLDPQTREQLIAQKPELKGLLGYYEDEGMTERVLTMLDNALASRDLPEYDSYDRDRREFILSRYRDLEQFVIANGDEVLEHLLELRERAEDTHSDGLTAAANLNADTLRHFLEALPGRLFSDIALSVGIDAKAGNAHRVVAGYLAERGGPVFERIEQAFAAASGHGAIIKALDDRIAEYANDGWSFESAYIWAAFVNPSNVIHSAIEVRISEWDLVYMATAGEEDDEHGYDAQKIAHNGAWDDVEWESTFERRRENGLIKRKTGAGAWDYVDAEFADSEHIEFDTGDLVDAAVEVYLNPRKAAPTIRDPRQFELTLEALRRRAGLGRVLVYPTRSRIRRPDKPISGSTRVAPVKPAIPSGVARRATTAAEGAMATPHPPRPCTVAAWASAQTGRP